MKDLIIKYVQNDLLAEMLARVIVFAVEMLIVYFVWNLAKTAIEKYRRKNPDNHRIGTIAGILTSTLKYVMYFFVFVSALEILLKINVMSVIAAAGVAGIAVAFGAQSVVKDVITGFFIIFEGKFEVGDIVTIDDFTGTVDSITLRCTTIRNYMGDLYIVPNGSIEKVINRQKGERYLSFDIDIAYESDIDTAIRVMEDCCRKAQNELSVIRGEAEVLGVTSLGRSGVTLRTIIPCEAGQQYALEREMLRRMKYAFDENNIEIPYDRLVVINKQGRQDHEQ